MRFIFFIAGILSFFMIFPHLSLGASLLSSYLSLVNTSTSTAQSFLSAHPIYSPSFPSKGKLDSTIYIGSSVQQLYLWTDPNTGIQYSQLISSDASQNLDWH